MHFLPFTAHLSGPLSYPLLGNCRRQGAELIEKELMKTSDSYGRQETTKVKISSSHLLQPLHRPTMRFGGSTDPMKHQTVVTRRENRTSKRGQLFHSLQRMYNSCRTRTHSGGIYHERHGQIKVHADGDNPNDEGNKSKLQIRA